MCACRGCTTTRWTRTQRSCGGWSLRSFPQWADLPIEPVPFGGTDNALYRLGDDLVVRLPRHERTVGTLEIERRWLPKLAPLLPLAVPAPVAEGVPADGYPWTWSIYEWLEGETATRERIADLGEAAIDLAEFVRALQRIDADRRAAAEQAQRLSRCAARHARREHARVDRRPGLDDRRRRSDDRLGSRP